MNTTPIGKIARLVPAVHEELSETTRPKEEWRLLRQFSAGVMKVRRSGREACRVESQRERTALDAQKMVTKKSSVNQAGSKQIKPFTAAAAAPDENA